MSAKYIAEPWTLTQSNDEAIEVTDDNGCIAFLEKFDPGTPADILGAAERRALRIIQCVNSCAGIADPASALTAARETVLTVVHDNLELAAIHLSTVALPPSHAMHIPAIQAAFELIRAAQTEIDHLTQPPNLRASNP